MNGRFFDSVTHLGSDFMYKCGCTRTLVAIQKTISEIHSAHSLFNITLMNSSKSLFPTRDKQVPRKAKAFWSCASLPKLNLDQPHISVTVYLDNIKTLIRFRQQPPKLLLSHLLGIQKHHHPNVQVTSTARASGRNRDPSQCPAPIDIVGMSMPNLSTHIASAHRQADPNPLSFNRENPQGSLI